MLCWLNPPLLGKRIHAELSLTRPPSCRALFGDQEECITTLQAWQQMMHEAKWFGRALYDAEEVVLLGCCPGGPWSE